MDRVQSAEQDCYRNKFGRYILSVSHGICAFLLTHFAIYRSEIYVKTLSSFVASAFDLAL